MIWIFALGGVPALCLLAALAWSIVVPNRRIWPPHRFTTGVQLRVWMLTTLVFVSGLTLGLRDWNGLDWPSVFRWGIGLPLLLAGNAAILAAVFQLGLRQTAGKGDALRTGGLYRFSRNPQYVADISICVGWFVLTASVWTAALGLLVVACLLVAPFAEEPWLRERYGAAFDAYRSDVRRYL